MALNLDISATVAERKTTEIPPLAPVDIGPDGKPVTVTVAGVKLAVCSRYADRPADFVLCRYREYKPATADYSPAIKALPATDARPAVAARAQIGKPERPAGWTATARCSDWFVAIKHGLVRAPKPA